LLVADDDLKSSILSHSNTAFIATFAQDDIIKTIVQGVNPFLEDLLVSENLKALTYQHKYLKQQIEMDINISEETKKLVLTHFKSQTPTVIHQKWLGRIQNVQEGLFATTASTISVLPKQDLADLAESWLHLTYLDRRMSNKPESVGGEVDIMLITKGDGIIWVKRKHYFTPELNSHYFRNKSLGGLQ
jgi:hypothetical protein